MYALMIGRRFVYGSLLAAVVLLLGWSVARRWNYDRYRRIMTEKYAVRENFPPLVYLPCVRKGPPVSACAAVLIEVKSGAVLYAKNAEIRRAPASTTKIMSAIVALEKGDLAKVVKVSRRAALTGGSTLRLRPGDRILLGELLEGMMLRSGNDGSIAVAEGVAGNVPNFVHWMNMKAKEIGALQTNFRNPHGLRAPSHYTTALDLALIARYGLANPRFARLVKTRTAVLEWVEKAKRVEIRNTNRLLWYVEGADGVKTGTTGEAGHCLVASATRDGKKFIAVVLHSHNRWADSARLLEYGFTDFSIFRIATARRSVGTVPVKNGKRRSLPLYPRHDLFAVVEKGYENRLQTAVIPSEEAFEAPVIAGEILGKIGYSYDGRYVAGVDLISRNPVKRRWFCW
jgi:D-alanyl-D-alanine carboxypeptidase (penicillin-binding protein 5/6)